mgnify:CR=1 FL=1
MNRILHSLSIAIFALFLGSQVTEGILLIPYWKSLSAEDFFEYYNAFGPQIGQFYTILTIVAVLIPIIVSIYFFKKNKRAFTYTALASISALGIIAVFYIYFKGTNQQFYDASLSPSELKTVLNTWEIWHWARVGLEVVTLVLLILGFGQVQKQQFQNL